MARGALWCVQAAAATPSHHGVNKTNGEIMSDLGVWSVKQPCSLYNITII